MCVGVGVGGLRGGVGAGVYVCVSVCFGMDRKTGCSVYMDVSKL